MVDVKAWMDGLAEKLRAEFGPRLLFLGLQGSYGRGEAGPDSDIDVVTVLDRAERADLDAYKAAVSTMPECEKACGFFCGGSELKNWPRYDLLSVVRDTTPVYGTLEALLPPLSQADLVEGILVGASALYHAACHTYLYRDAERLPGFLAGTRKSVFFLLRDLHELRTGETARAKRELLPRLSEAERAVLEGRGGPEEDFERLLRWTSDAMAEARRAKNSLT